MAHPLAFLRHAVCRPCRWRGPQPSLPATRSLPPQACVLAVAGAVLCLVPVPAVLAGADAAIVRALCPCRTAAVADLARGGRHQYSEVGREDSGDSLLDRADAGTVAAAPRKEPAVAPGAAVEAPAAAAQPPPPSSPAGLLRLRTPAWALALAWAVLAGTAAIGIVCTTYFEHSLGLSMFGYAAVDQVLLPFTTLPLTAAAVRVAWVADLIGEPAEGRDATVRASLGRTWAEADWRTLVPFRASMFGREFLFFWLVTAFSDLTTTYLQMTILRVVLCWLASLLVCAFFRAWSGVSDEEADGALRPSTLLFRLAGSAVLVASYLRLQGVL